jgi:cbb3-type cytochrome oxidase subunit 3
MVKMAFFTVIIIIFIFFIGIIYQIKSYKHNK